MNNGVHAPYNFVPFSNRILFPYGSMDELPSHGTWEPGLKTGKILISMKAETPVFVSNGDKKNPQFFRTPGGDRALPGSTVRGMVRENMQILGFGLVQKGKDLEDYQIFFRDMTSATGSTGDERKKHYQNALDIKTKRSETGKTYTVPERVQAGYLRRDGDTYRILPTQGPHFRISRTAEVAKAFRSEKDGQTIEVFYREKGDKVTALRRADKFTPHGNDWKHGFLLFTGKPIKTNPLYLFPDPNPEADSLPLKKEDVLSYAEDWEHRQNVLKPDKDFWKLPKDGKQKPVFYTDYDGHIYWGMSLFLRVGYPYSLAHGLPQPHQKAVETPHGVDYPHAILGFADRKSAYRSRVSFGDLLAVGNVKECKPVSMILGEPKPSYYPGYAYGREKNNDNAVRHYANEDFKLRGYKLYWHKAEVEPSEVPDGKERVGTTLRPLDKDTVFRGGGIRFKNLTPEELGLLLWSLRLDEGCFQSVGMGKPYGYGRMKLEIEGLTVYTPEDLYDGTLTARGTAKGRDAIDEYIRAYDRAACETLGVKPQKDTGEVSIRNRPDIKDFFYMKRTIQHGPEFSYMKLAEYKNNRSPLPKAAKFREEDEEKARRAAEEAAKPTDMASLLQQLASQKNGGVGGANGSASGGGASKSKKSKRKKKR